MTFGNYKSLSEITNIKVNFYFNLWKIKVKGQIKVNNWLIEERYLVLQFNIFSILKPCFKRSKATEVGIEQSVQRFSRNPVHKSEIFMLTQILLKVCEILNILTIRCPQAPRPTSRCLWCRGVSQNAHGRVSELFFTVKQGPWVFPTVPGSSFVSCSS